MLFLKIIVRYEDNKENVELVHSLGEYTDRDLKQMVRDSKELKLTLELLHSHKLLNTENVEDVTIEIQHYKEASVDYELLGQIHLELNKE